LGTIQILGSTQQLFVLMKSMSKTVHAKQCILDDFWRQKTPKRQVQAFDMATKCSQLQEANDALKQIFGHEAYKSDVQRKAIKAILTGLQLRVICLLSLSC